MCLYNIDYNSWYIYENKGIVIFNEVAPRLIQSGNQNKI